jgi:AcrR family transcriptional regulator
MVSDSDLKSAKRESVREAILDAMGRLIERMGYHKTTVEDIASEVGIGKGTVYLHFASKEDIALQWLDRTHSEMIEKLEVVAKRKAEAGDRAKCFLIAHVMLRFDRFATLPNSIEQMMAALRPELMARKEVSHKREAEILSVILQEIQAGPPEHSLSAATAMITATNSLMPYSLKIHEIGNRATVLRTATRIAELLIGGYMYESTSQA